MRSWYALESPDVRTAKSDETLERVSEWRTTDFKSPTASAVPSSPVNFFCLPFWEARLVRV